METLEERKEKLKNIASGRIVIIIILLLCGASLYSMWYYMDNKATKDFEIIYTMGFEDGTEIAWERITKSLYSDLYSASTDCDKVSSQWVEEVNDSLIFVPYNCLSG